jgi:uncharacterized membrane protein YfcA
MNEWWIAIGLFAAVCEVIDCSFGMGYGTIMSPLLLLWGFEPTVVVPGILASQGISGLLAASIHHTLGNARFTTRSMDTKTFLLFMLGGVAATIFAANVAFCIPAIIIKRYIGILVALMGILVTLHLRFKMRWSSMVAIGILSAFNKGISGGAFGPVATAGQIIGGNDHKASVAITTLSEGPICFAACIVYFVKVGSLPDSKLLFSLIFGALTGACIGPYITYHVPHRLMQYILGVLITVLGAWLLLKTF